MDRGVLAYCIIEVKNSLVEGVELIFGWRKFEVKRKWRWKRGEKRRGEMEERERGR